MTSKSTLQKIGASILIASMLVTAVPQKAQAQGLPTIDFANLVQGILGIVKEFALDTATYAAARVLTAQVINNMIGFVNEGLGDDGNPLYITNQESFFNEIRDVELVKMKSELNVDLADITTLDSLRLQDAQILSNLTINRDVDLAEKLEPTLSDEQITNFSSDFASGGWDAWQEFGKRQNNPLGREAIIKEDYYTRVAKEQELAAQELAQNNGFLSDKVGVACDTLDTIGGTFNNITSTVNNAGGTLDGVNEQLSSWTGEANQIFSDLDNFTYNPLCERFDVLTPGNAVGELLNRSVVSRIEQQEDVSELSQIVGGAIANFTNSLINRGVARLRSGSSSPTQSVGTSQSLGLTDASGNVDWLNTPHLIVNIETDFPRAIATTGEMVAYLEKTTEFYATYPGKVFTLDQCLPGPDFGWESRMVNMFNFLKESEENRISEWTNDNKPEGYSRKFREVTGTLRFYLDEAIKKTRAAMRNPAYQILGPKLTQDIFLQIDQISTLGRKNAEKREELFKYKNLYANLTNLKNELVGMGYEEGTWEWTDTTEWVGEWNSPANEWPTAEEWNDLLTQGIDPDTGRVYHIRTDTGATVNPNDLPIDPVTGDLLTPGDPGYYEIVPDPVYAPIVSRRNRLIAQFASYNQTLPVDNQIATAQTDVRDAQSSLRSIDTLINECASVRTLAGFPDNRTIGSFTLRDTTFRDLRMRDATPTTLFEEDERAWVGRTSGLVQGSSAKVTQYAVTFEPQGNYHPANTFSEISLGNPNQLVAIRPSIGMVPPWTQGDSNGNGTTDYTITLDQSSSNISIILPGDSAFVIDIHTTVKDNVPGLVNTNDKQTWKVWVDSITTLNGNNQTFVANAITGESTFTVEPAANGSNTTKTLNAFTLVPQSIQDFLNMDVARPVIEEPYDTSINNILRRDSQNLLFCGYQSGISPTTGTIPNIEYQLALPSISSGMNGVEDGNPKSFDWRGFPACDLFAATSQRIRYSLDPEANPFRPIEKPSLWRPIKALSLLDSMDFYANESIYLLGTTGYMDAGINQWYNADIADYERAFNPTPVQ